MRLVGSSPATVGLLISGDRGEDAPSISNAYFDEEGDLLFEMSDSTVIGPLEVPDGVLCFVDNGDSTWSVG